MAVRKKLLNENLYFVGIITTLEHATINSNNEKEEIRRTWNETKIITENSNMLSRINNKTGHIRKLLTHSYKIIATENHFITIILWHSMPSEILSVKHVSRKYKHHVHHNQATARIRQKKKVRFFVRLVRAIGMKWTPCQDLTRLKYK